MAPSMIAPCPQYSERHSSLVVQRSEGASNLSWEEQRTGRGHSTKELRPTNNALIQLDSSRKPTILEPCNSSFWIGQVSSFWSIVGNKLIWSILVPLLLSLSEIDLGASSRARTRITLLCIHSQRHRFWLGNDSLLVFVFLRIRSSPTYSDTPTYQYVMDNSVSRQESFDSMVFQKVLESFAGYCGICTCQKKILLDCRATNSSLLHARSLPAERAIVSPTFSIYNSFETTWSTNLSQWSWSHR